MVFKQRNPPKTQNMIEVLVLDCTIMKISLFRFFYKSTISSWRKMCEKRWNSLPFQGKLWNTVRSGSLPAGVMEGLQSSEVPPCWRKTVLQVFATALTRSLEKLNVASQPGLVEKKQNVSWRVIFTERVAMHSGIALLAESICNVN